jgi:2-methylcitrate dehydratase PrpD
MDGPVTVAQKLSDCLASVTAADLPEQALRHAAMIIASTIASAACGAGIRSAQIIRELAKEQGGRPDASLWFDAGSKLPVAEAARVNAILSDAAASDDSDLRNIVHAGTPLTATSLAMAERVGATGEEVLTAMVIGYEAAGRISEAITPGFRRQGFHGCLGAVFAATVAAARLLRLDAPGMAQSIAIAATSIGGLATAADTSTAREYHAGLAALLGCNAALAAQRGYQAEEAILECPKGFFEAFGSVDGAAAAATATADLGENWDIITDMAIKLMPGGHPYHAIAEAAANAARDGDITTERIATIIVSRPGLTVLTGPRHPGNLIDMAHSPAYFAAAGAADRNFSWIHASPEKIGDPTIHRLIDKVTVGLQPLENIGRYRQGATVTIRSVDGAESSSTVFVPQGAAQLGIAWTEIDAKYRALVPASGLSAEKVEASLTAIHGVREAKSVEALVELVRWM